MTRGLLFPKGAPVVLWDLSNLTYDQIQEALTIVPEASAARSEYDWGGFRIWLCTEGDKSRVEDLGNIDDDFEVSTQILLDTLERILKFRREMSEEQARREVDYAFKLISMNPQLYPADHNPYFYEVPQDGFHLRLKMRQPHHAPTTPPSPYEKATPATAPLRPLACENGSWALVECPDQGLFISVMVGSIALYEVDFLLEPEEIHDYRSGGRAYLEGLATHVRKAPGSYSSRSQNFHQLGVPRWAVS